jgi:hypothetical protein
MPGDPKECRQHAFRCLNLAKSASTPQAKQKFLQLADHWTMLARDLEELKAILEADAKAGDCR